MQFIQTRTHFDSPHYAFPFLWIQNVQSGAHTHSHTQAHTHIHAIKRGQYKTRDGGCMNRTRVRRDCAWGCVSGVEPAARGSRFVHIYTHTHKHTQGVAFIYLWEKRLISPTAVRLKRGLTSPPLCSSPLLFLSSSFLLTSSPVARVSLFAK